MRMLIILEHPATLKDLQQAKEFSEKRGKQFRVVDKLRIEIFSNEKTKALQTTPNGYKTA